MIANAAYLMVAAVLGFGVPWLGMRMLGPSLMESRTTTNYRGREVFLGLGVVWLLWAAAAILAGLLSFIPDAVTAPALLLVLAGPLALVAFALGLFDDAYGSSAARGFKGHLSAMAHGRLTTGGMKLLGISLASYIAAAIVIDARGDSMQLALEPLLWALPAGAGIALTSNFINLADLRPGRALKAYSFLAVCGVISSSVGLAWMRAGSGSRLESTLYTAAILAIFAFGPVLAVWRYDLGELGMLGDAGANPAGAVAGLLIVAGLPAWGTIVYFALMLALNLASERVSFSKVIEGNAFLSRLDALGRPPVE